MSPQVVSGSRVGSRRESLRSAPPPPVPPCARRERRATAGGCKRKRVSVQLPSWNRGARARAGGCHQHLSDGRVGGPECCCLPPRGWCGPRPGARTARPGPPMRCAGTYPGPQHVTHVLPLDPPRPTGTVGPDVPPRSTRTWRPVYSVLFFLFRVGVSWISHRSSQTHTRCGEGWPRRPAARGEADARPRLCAHVTRVLPARCLRAACALPRRSRALGPWPWTPMVPALFPCARHDAAASVWVRRAAPRAGGAQDGIGMLRVQGGAARHAGHQHDQRALRLHLHRRGTQTGANCALACRAARAARHAPRAGASLRWLRAGTRSSAAVCGLRRVT